MAEYLHSEFVVRLSQSVGEADISGLDVPVVGDKFMPTVEIVVLSSWTNMLTELFTLLTESLATTLMVQLPLAVQPSSLSEATTQKVVVVELSLENVHITDVN
ncbi:hypothetical protein HYU12_03775 [Candidatus Woesearchaeota archaeon]|nr:hypothetical protein [Candidatus Woesearchaeota archaeon]